jgi:hypothetical protein
MPNWKKVIVSGSDAALNSLLVTTSVTASNVLIQSSGSTLLTISGSAGELFTITDDLSGDLLSVTDANGDAILNVSASYEINLGNPAATSLYATATASFGTTPATIYSISTASYDGAWFEYTLRSGSNARAGSVMSIWDTSANINFTETTTTDIGDTSGASIQVTISGSSACLSGSASTDGWQIKTIIRSI